MFGYIVLNDKISASQKEQYRSFYCGLCDCLKNDYGHKVTMFHSNDMTFLSIILAGLYEPDLFHDELTCVMHPLKKHKQVRHQYDHYVADMSIVLAYYKALDDVHDENRHHRQLKILTKPFLKVKEKYPLKIERIEKALNHINELEKEGCTNLDQMCNAFSVVMGEIFAYDDDIWKDDLYILGANLGKFIYLMDAYDDIEDDIKKKTYNPFKENYHQDQFEEYVESLLNLFISEATMAFERLPILLNGDILRNVLYSGVWSRFESVKNKRKKGNMNESV